MSPWPTQHCTADDLDAFHAGALSVEMQLHLETCDACRQLLAADADLVGRLSRLESFAPSAGFADRVMAKVTIGAPAPVPVLSFPKLSRPRLALIAGMAALMIATVAWSAAYRSELDAFLHGLGGALLRFGWQTIRSLAAQPWVAAARETWLEPVRLVVGALVAGLVYGSGLLALRRLVAPSAAPVSDATP